MKLDDERMYVCVHGSFFLTIDYFVVNEQEFTLLKSKG